MGGGWKFERVLDPRRETHKLREKNMMNKKLRETVY